MADRVAVSFSSGALQGISQTVPDNILAGGLKRASGDVTIDAGGANSILLRTNGTTSVTVNSGGKLTTSSTTTTPAILIGSFAGDPSGLTNGDIWYNSTTNKFRARENGASTDLISAGTASGWQDDGTVVRLTTTTDNVNVGGTTDLGKFAVQGDTDEIQLVVRGNASQTANIVQFGNSAGSAAWTSSAAGATNQLGGFSIGGTQVLDSSRNLTISLLPTPSGSLNLGSAGQRWGTVTAATYSINDGADERFRVNSLGQILFGITTMDVQLSRSAANTLELASGDTFDIANGSLTFGGVTVITSSRRVVTFSTSTLPGLKVGTVSGDPSTLTDGDIWYDTGTAKFRARQNSTSVDLISSPSGWTDAGAEVHLTTSTDEVTVGPSGGTAGKFTVVGDTAAQKTIVAKQAAAQTAAALTIQNSAGTDLMTVTGLTTLTYQHSTALSTVTFRSEDEVAGGGAAGTMEVRGGIGGAASSGFNAGSGGGINIYSGTGGAAADVGTGGNAAAGGTVTISSGDGGAGNTGTNPHNASNGGTVQIVGGSGGAGTTGASAGFGGNITLVGGTGGDPTFGSTPGNGGTISLLGGYGATGTATSYGGNGGSITIYGGDGGYNSGGSGPGTPGDVTIRGGVGGYGDTVNGTSGGYAYLRGGEGGGGSGSTLAGSGGYVYVTGGAGGLDGGGGGAAGGDVYVNGGNASGSATDGLVNIGTGDTSQVNIGTSNLPVNVIGYMLTTATSTRPAVTIGTVAGDPSTLTNGAIWYNTSTGKFRARENGSSVDMISAGTSGWTDDGATVRLTTATDEVAIGTATAFAKLGVLNDATGQPVIAARCASGQSSNPFEIQNNAGTAYFTLDITGRMTLTAGPSGTGTCRAYIDANSGGPTYVWDRNGNGTGAVAITHTANSVLDVTASTTIQPGTTNTGSIGASGRKWNAAFITTVTTGDLVMEDESRDASWRFVEHHEHIQVINQKTGKKYKLMLQEEAE